MSEKFIALDFQPEDDSESIQSMLRINEMNPESDMIVCSAQYYYYAKMADDAELLLQQFTLQREIHEARLTRTLREKKEPIIGKDGTVTMKLTNRYEKEADLSRAYMCDEIWIGLKQREMQASYNAKVLSKAARALETKAKLLQSFNKRQLTLHSKNGSDE